VRADATSGFDARLNLPEPLLPTTTVSVMVRVLLRCYTIERSFLGMTTTA
jgi:hypothetical protein